ncbi:hypothetical protein DM828_13800 [Pseudomonas umsongensis]|nr:hypothetical protein [Pseudomonas umsongensis]
MGASLLAMVVNENAGCLTPRGACSSIASRLAPTESPHTLRRVHDPASKTPPRRLEPCPKTPVLDGHFFLLPIVVISPELSAPCAKSPSLCASLRCAC